jgi:hypothetical protein
MLRGRTFVGKKLPLTAVFVLLVVAAFGAGCKGFFPNPTLQSIAIQPPTPQILLGKTLNLQAWGTYNDGSRSQITSGVSWTSNPSTVASIDPNSGVATGQALGTSTITAAAQGLSGTATATVFVVITSLTVNPTTWTLTANTTSSTTFTVTANGNQDVTSTATFTPSNTSFFSCVDGTNPVTCTATNPTAGTYTITVSYPGSTLTATVNITVS